MFQMLGVQCFKCWGFSVSNATINRFYSLHYLLPFVLTALILVHLIALHF